MNRGGEVVLGWGVVEQDARGGLKTFRCGDVVPGCREVFRGPEATILSLVAAHAPEHGVEVDDGVLEVVRRSIRPA